MRFIVSAATAVLLAVPVLGWAQTSSPAPATDAPAPPAAAAPSGSTAPSSTAPTTRTRKTLQQRFDAANTTRDGHLTKDQATAARWTYVSRNFDKMDKTHQGFVTADDIRSYAADRRAARKTSGTHS